MKKRTYSAEYNIPIYGCAYYSDGKRLGFTSHFGEIAAELARQNWRAFTNRPKPWAIVFPVAATEG